MRTAAALLAALGLLAGAVFADRAAAADAEEGFVSLFDGKTLDGWEGNPELWSVVDGAIVGQTTSEKPLTHNTFLVYRKAAPADFELRVKYRIHAGNSGIQYRSREVDAERWILGGYQADIDAGNSYTGILYEERGRGILAGRGQKVAVAADGAKTNVGEATPSAEILQALAADGWNEYTIVARGNHLVQKINGLTTMELTDHQESARRLEGLIAFQLHQGPPMKVEFKEIRIKVFDAPQPTPSPAAEKTRIVFLAGRPSHGYNSHEHNAGCRLLARALAAAMPHVETVVYNDPEPTDPAALDGAAAIVLFADGGGGNPVNRRLEQLDRLARQGVGIVALHYAVEVPKGPSGEKMLEWIGGYFETHWSVNPHWTAEFTRFPDHPAARGLRPFAINDEWYFHMRFREGMQGVTPILSAIAPEETMRRGDGPHSGNPDVRRSVAAGEPQHLAWAAERADGGRGFGFTGGHWHYNWAHDQFRTTVLNGIVWAAGLEVPEGGVPSKTPTIEELKQHQDYDEPANYDWGRIERLIAEWNAP